MPIVDSFPGTVSQAQMPHETGELHTPALAGPCPTVPSGHWTGTWQSDQTDLAGTLSVEIERDGERFDGTLELEGSPVVLDANITGVIDCLSVRLGNSDEALTFNGTLDPTGTQFTGNFNLPFMDVGTISAWLIDS
ncbi:MAG: hypothetical protein R8F63_00835 [Acidimicrobiales bacterium]|nr:hypothetical protein [Acidimicrobiales bacterium]